MSRKETFRELFLGIEKVDGREKVSKAGILRVSKTLFISGWILLNLAKISLTDATQIIYKPVYQTGIISTFLMTYGYYRSKDDVIQLTRKNNYLYEEK